MAINIIVYVIIYLTNRLLLDILGGLQYFTVINNWLYIPEAKSF